MIDIWGWLPGGMNVLAWAFTIGVPLAWVIGKLTSPPE